MTKPKQQPQPPQRIRLLLLLLCVLSPLQAMGHALSEYALENADVLFDRSGSLTPQQLVSNQYRHRFIPWDRTNFYFTQDSTVWLRFTLPISETASQPYEIRAQTFGDDDITYYLHRDRTTKGSDELNELTSHSQFSHNQHLIPFEYHPGEQLTLYVRMHSPFHKRISAWLSKPNNEHHAIQKTHWFFGIWAGINIALILVTLTLFLTRKRVDCLQLFGISLICLVFLLSWQGIPASLWRLFPDAQNRVHFASIAAGYGLLCLLSRTLLETSKSRAADRLLLLMSTGSFVTALIMLFPGYVLPENAIVILSLMSCASSIITGVIRLYEGYIAAWRWLLVVVPYTMIFITFVLCQFGILPFDIWMMQSTLVSSVLILVTGLSLSFLIRSAAPVSRYGNLAPESDPQPTDKPARPLWSYIGHDIRTPMNGILGMSELLQNTSLTPRQKDYVNTIQLSGREMLNLVNQVVDNVKTEVEPPQTESFPFEITELVQVCMDRYRYKSEQLGIELISFIQPDMPEFLAGDTERIRQILLALLAYNFNHIADGEILLTVSPQTLSATGDPDNTKDQKTLARFTLKCSDNGIGYRTLRPYADSMADTLSENDTQPPVGILLARNMVKRLGGSFNLMTDGQNTIYWFTLPLTILPELTPDSSDDPKAIQLLSNRKVLVVDDNDTCRKVLVRQCMHLGLDVYQTRNATEALALLRTEASLSNPFDLAILDQNMPGTSGMQLATRIADDPLLKDRLLVIMLTGSSIPTTQQTETSSIRCILTKPVSSKRLGKVLVKELSQTARIKVSTATTI